MTESEVDQEPMSPASGVCPVRGSSGWNDSRRVRASGCSACGGLFVAVSHRIRRGISASLGGCVGRLTRHVTTSDDQKTDVHTPGGESKR